MLGNVTEDWSVCLKFPRFWIACYCWIDKVRMRAFIDVTLVNVRLRARAHECTIRYPQHKKQWQLSPIKGYSPVHVSKFVFFSKTSSVFFRSSCCNFLSGLSFGIKATRNQIYQNKQKVGMNGKRQSKSKAGYILPVGRRTQKRNGWKYRILILLALPVVNRICRYAHRMSRQMWFR